jgi:hypothetical protein
MKKVVSGPGWSIDNTPNPADENGWFFFRIDSADLKIA